jgi:hypothetical protein
VIQQVLNRDFVLSCMAQVTAYIEQTTRAGECRGEETDLSQFPTTDRAEILETLREAQRSEAADSSGQEDYNAGSQRRGESLAERED